MFKNVKIRKLVVFSFCVILLMMIIMGILSIQYSYNLSRQTQTLYNRPHTNLVNMWAVKTKTLEVGSALKKSYMAGIPLGLEKAAANANAVPKMIEAIENNKIDVNSKATDDMLEIMNTADAWSKVAKEIIAILEGGKEADNQVIQNLYMECDQNEALLLEKMDVIIESAAANALRFKDNSSNMAKQVTNILKYFFIVTIVLALFILKLILDNISRPMKAITIAADQISQGNLNSKIEYKSSNEFGHLANQFKEMQRYLKSVVSDIDFLLGEIGQGYFNVHSKIEYVGNFAPIWDSIDNIVVNLSGTIKDINVSAEQVSAGSDQISAGAQVLSIGATQQAGSIVELSSAISTISKQITTNAKSAAEANEIASTAGMAIEESNSQMREMVGAIEEINTNSMEIAKIIKTIEDIAFQTNILALNAAVEAARAGTAGKGFAVVADEVRNLASKSAEASKNTAAMIENAVNAVQRGTKISEGTANSLENSVGNVKSVVSMLDQISLATKDQAQSIEQVNRGLDQISNVVQANSATSEQSAASSEELSAQAQILKGMVGKFQLKGEEGKNSYPLLP